MQTKPVKIGGVKMFEGKGLKKIFHLDFLGKEVKGMRKWTILMLGLVMVMGLVSTSFAKVVTINNYAANGVLSSSSAMEYTDLDPQGHLLNETTYAANGDKILSVGYVNGERNNITNYQYGTDGKLLSSTIAKVADPTYSYTTYYDDAGQGIITVDNVHKAVDSPGNAMDTYGVFLGDPDGTNGNADTREQGATGQNLLNLITRLGSRTGIAINNANFDTHSGFHFASITGKLVTRVALDTNGDGQIDQSWDFSFTRNQATGAGANQAIFASSKTTYDGAGKELVKTDFDDPSGLHNDGHWDPAISIGGVLNQDQNGTFYVIDNAGARHNLDVGDPNLAAQLSANLGRMIQVTGDHSDNDPGASLIFLQSFALMP